MGCPDGAPCDSQYFGFYNQVSQAARHLNCFYQASEGTPCSGFFTPITKGVRTIAYNPNSACGSSSVNIVNGATAALYDYTPYQPNAAAIAAGFGTGDSCSSYGNRNFYNYFTSWFGSTYTPAYDSRFAGQSAYPTIIKGSSADTYISYINTGNQPWYDDTTATANSAKPVHLATSHALNRYSLVGTWWGGDQNRPAGTFAAVYEADGTTPAGNQHVVQPGQIAKFNIKFFGPTNLTAGVYREFFQPILEGQSSMNDPWTFLDVTIQDPVYASAYAGQSVYPTIARGSSADSYIQYKNVGNQVWYDDTNAAANAAKPVHLATAGPLNRYSLVGTWWGGDQNRPGGTFAAVYEADGTTLAADQHVGQPGQIVRFGIKFFGPTNLPAGSKYREFFQPIVEGGSLMNNPGTFLDVTLQ
jgi:hypothetical protein